MTDRRVFATAVLVTVGLGAPGPAATQTTWRVAPGGELPTIAAGLERAAPDDTVRVAPGTYRERLVVERSVILIGEGWPVIDGGGGGHVVEARARMALRGFVVRGSGTRVDREDAGIMVEGATARIEDNRIEDVLYGIYLKQAPGSLVRGNRIRGKPLPLPRRGDGIRLWYSPDTRIAGNVVHGTRDLVLYFSDRLVVEGNRIEDARYGLHTMYSSDSRFLGNRVAGSQVGAFLMYSRDLLLEGNVFANATGASGMGIGLKDADDVRVEGNLVVDNAVGAHLDNSPRSEGVTNRFTRNVFVANEVAVRLLPSVKSNGFHGNAFVANGRPAEVAGGARGGQVRQNDWSGNHWSAYAGFDEDGDGVGDTPYEHVRLADELKSRYPALRVFARSPALSGLDVLGRFLPLLEPEPVVVDPAPRLTAGALDAWRGEVPMMVGRPGKESTEVAWATLWVVVAVGGLGVVLRSTRPRRGDR